MSDNKQKPVTGGVAAAVYARYSSHSQGEQSIEGQLAEAQKYAAEKGYTIVREYIDRAKSGRTDNREEFQRMLRDTAKKQFSVVILWKVDRFGRNREEIAINKMKCRKNGVSVEYVAEKIPDTPEGVILESVLEGFAEYYSLQLSQNIKRGIAESAKKCQVTGGGTALGYKIDKDTKKYVIDEATAPVVKHIFEMYADGATVADICRYMNSHGIRTSRGNEFNKNSLRKMLTNKRYIGIYTFKGEEIPGGMPQIIDEKLFQQVQDKMQKNKKAPARARAKEEYLLTTKLFCGYCKEMMTGYGGTGKSGKQHHYYICNGVKRKSGCHKKTVRKQEIEDMVIDVCRQLLTDENIDTLVQQVIEAIAKQPKNEDLEAYRNELKATEKKRANLLNAVTECEIDVVRKSLYEQLAAVEERRSDLEYRIQVEQAKMTVLKPSMVRYFFLSLKRGSFDDLVTRRALIATFVNKIYLYDDKLTIHLNTGGNPVEITGKIIEEVEESNAEAECSFKGRSAPPFESRMNAVENTFVRLFDIK